MKARSRAAAWACIVALVLAPATGWAAPTPEERAVAQALFEEGRRLMDEGRFPEACEKLAESQRLDPGMGTQFNLGDCYERVGRFAEAWVLFVDVAAAARAAGLGDREAIARLRAELLSPRLTRVRVIVRAPVPGLALFRLPIADGAPEPHPRSSIAVPSAQWSSAVPVQPGRYRFEARAPGHASFTRDLDVQGEGATVELVVPPLLPLPPAAEPEPPSTPGQGLRIAAVVMAGAGGVGIGVGAIAGSVAISKKNESLQHCPTSDACFDRGIELRDEARTAAAVSTGGFVIGASALVGATILWLSAPDAPAVGVSAGPGGVAVRIRF